MTVELRFFPDAKAVAIAGEHAVVLDRDKSQGGDNSGFRARELWVISLLACASGTLNALAREQGYPQAIRAAQGSWRLDAHGDIARVDLQFRFANAIHPQQRQHWLTILRQRCLLLKTVQADIELSLQASESAAQNAAEDEETAACGSLNQDAAPACRLSC